MKKVFCGVFVFLWGTAIATASPPKRHHVSSIVSVGWSYSEEHHVANLAPPSVEGRYIYLLSPSFGLQTGLGLLSFPETVFESRWALTTRPLAALTNLPGLRGLYLSAGPQFLMAADGFDFSVRGEGGCIIDVSQLTFQVGYSLTKHLRNPRIANEFNIGVGVTF